MGLDQVIIRENSRVPQAPEEARQNAVFIVDDEAMVGEVVSLVLGTEGFNTRLFTCPLDAIEALESASVKPDLLITDFVMQPLSGVDLIERCRSLVPGLRTILYSGCLGDEPSEEIRRSADALLSKPFLPKELIRTVKSVLAA